MQQPMDITMNGVFLPVFALVFFAATATLFIVQIQLYLGYDVTPCMSCEFGCMLDIYPDINCTTYHL